MTQNVKCSIPIIINIMFPRKGFIIKYIFKKKLMTTWSLTPDAYHYSIILFWRSASINNITEYDDAHNITVSVSWIFTILTSVNIEIGP